MLSQMSLSVSQTQSAPDSPRSSLGGRILLGQCESVDCNKANSRFALTVAVAAG